MTKEKVGMLFDSTNVVFFLHVISSEQHWAFIKSNLRLTNCLKRLQVIQKPTKTK